MKLLLVAVRYSCFLFSVIFCAGLWSSSAHAMNIQCSNESGSCIMELEDNIVRTICECRDCSPNHFQAGNNPDDFSAESCMGSLELFCVGEPVISASEECTQSSIELCESGVETLLKNCHDIPREDEFCVTVICCGIVEKAGFIEYEKYWKCAQPFGVNCDAIMENCGNFPGESTDPGPSMCEDHCFSESVSEIRNNSCSMLGNASCNLLWFTVVCLVVFRTTLRGRNIWE